MDGHVSCDIHRCVALLRLQDDWLVESLPSLAIFQKVYQCLKVPPDLNLFFLHQLMKSSQKLFVQGYVMNKCSRDSNSLSCSQNVHNGEVVKPSLLRNEFADKYKNILCMSALFWNYGRFIISEKCLVTHIFLLGFQCPLLRSTFFPWSYPLQKYICIRKHRP